MSNFTVLLFKNDIKITKTWETNKQNPQILSTIALHQAMTVQSYCIEYVTKPPIWY